jgi:hypothetical protein
MPVCLSFCVRVCLPGRPEIWDWRPAPFYADDLALLTIEPRDMQIMLSRLAVCTRNEHLIVTTSKSEVVHFNSAGENVPVLMLAVPPFITKILLGIWAFRYLGNIFNMAKHASRPFLASAYRVCRFLREHALAAHFFWYVSKR